MGRWVFWLSSFQISKVVYILRKGSPLGPNRNYFLLPDRFRLAQTWIFNSQFLEGSHDLSLSL